MPGFAFEDRQYSLDLRMFPVAMIGPARKLQLILAEVNLRAVVGLPIMAGKRLINGYVCEVSVLNEQTCFYLSDESVCLVTRIARENAAAGERLGDARAKMVARIGDGQSSEASVCSRMPEKNARPNKKLRGSHSGKMKAIIGIF